jgi:mono/diheme cytochrome c family protein
MRICSYCASCHKENGEGVKGNFPPLKGNQVVTGNKKALISTLLNGLSGRLLVHAETYDQKMPSFRFLSDEDLAAVLSYIRSDFNQHTDPVTAREAASVRRSLGSSGAGRKARTF